LSTPLISTNVDGFDKVNDGAIAENPLGFLKCRLLGLGGCALPRAILEAMCEGSDFCVHMAELQEAASRIIGFAR